MRPVTIDLQIGRVARVPCSGSGLMGGTTYRTPLRGAPAAPAPPVGPASRLH